MGREQKFSDLLYLLPLSAELSALIPLITHSLLYLHQMSKFLVGFAVISLPECFMKMKDLKLVTSNQ